MHYFYVHFYIITIRTSECIENIFTIFPYLPNICICENIKARVSSLVGNMWTNFGTPKYAIIKHIHYKVRQLRWEPKKRTKKAGKVSR